MIDSTHEFIILDVQEDQFRPKMCTFRSLDDLGDVDARDEQLEMLHNYRIYQRVAQIREHQKDLRFSGLYLLYRIASSVKIPI